MKNKKITSQTTLSEILEYPGAAEILIKHKVPCLGCPFAAMEMKYLKIGDIARMYGIKLDALLREINKLSQNKKRK